MTMVCYIFKYLIQYIGMIDEVAVFNRELSEDEVKNIFYNGINVSPVESKRKLATLWGKVKDSL